MPDQDNKPIQGTLPKGSVVDPNTVGHIEGNATGTVGGNVTGKVEADVEAKAKAEAEAKAKAEARAQVAATAEAKAKATAEAPKTGAGVTPGNPLHDQEMINDRYTAAKQAALAAAAKLGTPKEQDERSQAAASKEPQSGHKSANELPPIGQREYDAFSDSQARMQEDVSTHTPEPKDRHQQTQREDDAHRDAQLHSSGNSPAQPLPAVPAPRKEGEMEVTLGRAGVSIEDALREIDEPDKTPEAELKEKRAKEHDPTHSGDSTGKPLEAHPKKYKVFIKGPQGEHYISNGDLQMHIKRNTEVIVSARVLEVLKRSQGLDFTYLPA